MTLLDFIKSEETFGEKENDLKATQFQSYFLTSEGI